MHKVSHETIISVSFLLNFLVQAINAQGLIHANSVSCLKSSDLTSRLTCEHACQRAQLQQTNKQNIFVNAAQTIAHTRVTAASVNYDVTVVKGAFRQT